MFNEWGEDGQTTFNPDRKAAQRELGINDYLTQMAEMKQNDTKKFEQTDK